MKSNRSAMAFVMALFVCRELKLDSPRKASHV